MPTRISSINQITSERKKQRAAEAELRTVADVAVKVGKLMRSWRFTDGYISKCIFFFCFKSLKWAWENGKMLVIACADCTQPVNKTLQHASWWFINTDNYIMSSDTQRSPQGTQRDWREVQNKHTAERRCWKNMEMFSHFKQQPQSKH